MGQIHPAQVVAVGEVEPESQHRAVAVGYTVRHRSDVCGVGLIRLGEVVIRVTLHRVCDETRAIRIQEALGIERLGHVQEPPPDLAGVARVTVRIAVPSLPGRERGGDVRLAVAQERCIRGLFEHLHDLVQTVERYREGNPLGIVAAGAVSYTDQVGGARTHESPHERVDRLFGAFLDLIPNEAVGAGDGGQSGIHGRLGLRRIGV